MRLLFFTGFRHIIPDPIDRIPFSLQIHGGKQLI